MRFRPPLHHVLRRAGVVAPLAIAVSLATIGHSVSAPAAVAARPVSAYSLDLPDLGGVRAAPVAQTRLSVARKQPRASRAAARKARKPAPARAWVRPSRGALTSGFGMRWGRMHRGVDFGAPYGSPIYAASSGVVTFAGGQSGYGRLVTIRHSGGWVTAYGHMSRTVVRSGQRVSAGQVIAYVGSEGRSTGPHLHFEVRRGGGAANPIPFLRSRGVRV